MRIVKSPPPDVAALLLELGPRTLVLVEGDDDCNAFEEWYRDDLGDLMFHSPGGGSSGVIRRLNEVLAISTKGRAFGIIDRDFRSEADISVLEAANPHLFVLRRYAIENYLLEPAALQEVLRVYYRGTHNPPTPAIVEQDLCQLCRNLRTLMAANWAFSETPGTEYFSEGYDISSRSLLIQQAAARLLCTNEQAEQRIAEKENLLDTLLGTLATAQTCTNGKHLLHQAFERFIRGVKPGMKKDHLESLLIQEVKRVGLNSDITTIIENRILKRP